MILAASLEILDIKSRDIVTRKLIEGFSELCSRAGVEVTGGQTVLNPWPIIGGTAMSCCSPNEFIMPVHALPGDVLILTKPLGTQVAVNVNVWLQTPEKPNWAKAQAIINLEQAYTAYDKAVESMTRLNLNAAKLMHKYGAHAATDVTGFGLIGHSRNLAKNQNAKVDFMIHTLPIIDLMDKIDELFGFNWKLLDGFSAETSGGLLIALPENKAKSFCQELEELDHQPAWIVGKVVESQSPENQATILENKTIINV
jgi:selenide,water dikinase